MNLSRRVWVIALSLASLLVALICYWGLPYYLVACALLGPALAAYAYVMAKILSLKSSPKVLLGIWMATLVLLSLAEIRIRSAPPSTTTAGTGALPWVVGTFNDWRNSPVAAAPTSGADVDPDKQAMAALKTLVVADQCKRQNLLILAKDTRWNEVVSEEATRTEDDIRDGKAALADYKKYRAELVDSLERTLTDGRVIIKGMSEYGQPSVMARFVNGQSALVDGEREYDAQLKPVLVDEEFLLDAASKNLGAASAPQSRADAQRAARDRDDQAAVAWRLKFDVDLFNQRVWLADKSREYGMDQLGSLLGIKLVGQALDTSTCQPPQAAPRRHHA